MLTISWVPLGIQRIYALITYDVPKSALQKTAEALSDEITSMVARFENSLSFYIYLFAGSPLFWKTMATWFKRGKISPSVTVVTTHRLTVK